MNKKILPLGLIIGAVVLIGAVAFSFSNTNTLETEKPVVAATIFPLYDLTRTVAGDDLTVELILPPGTSPHTFDPTPKQLKALKDADIVFTVGHELDTWVHDIIPEDARIVTLDHDIALRDFPTTEEDGEHHEDEHDHDEEGEHHEDEHGHDEEGEHHEDEHGHDEEADHHDHSHDGVDPHYWLDPRNGAIMAHTIEEELSETYPEFATQFAARTEAFATELAGSMTAWESALAPVRGRSFATLHDAFYYLADFAQVTLAATFEPSPGKEPTPKYLATLTHEIEEYNISALFNEPQLSFSGLEAFAADNDLTLGTLDPIGGIDERLSYIALIEYNVDALVNALR